MQGPLCLHLSSCSEEALCYEQTTLVFVRLVVSWVSLYFLRMDNGKLAAAFEITSNFRFASVILKYDALVSVCLPPLPPILPLHRYLPPLLPPPIPLSTLVPPALFFSF